MELTAEFKRLIRRYECGGELLNVRRNLIQRQKFGAVDRLSREITIRRLTGRERLLFPFVDNS